MDSDNDALLIAELRRDEGVRLKPYRCTAGKLTVGIGRNLDDVGITDAEADFMLRNDIAKCKAQLDKALPWWALLDETRKRALVNLCFNLGIGGLLTFTNTLAAIKAKDWPRASAGLLSSRWAEQVGARAQRIAKMMRTGAV